jgi:hypothetical protein
MINRGSALQILVHLDNLNETNPDFNEGNFFQTLLHHGNRGNQYAHRRTGYKYVEVKSCKLWVLSAETSITSAKTNKL